MSAAGKVTLFGHWICPYSVRVEFALAQRGIPYDLVDVPPSAVRPRGYVVPAEFELHSPKREIPLVRIGGEYLADSMPILEWLERRYHESPLLPVDANAAAFVREQMIWIDRNVYRPMIGVYYGSDPALIGAASDRFGVAITTVGESLGARPWLAGEQPTLAGALMVAVYVRLGGLRRLGLTAPVPSAVSAHIERCRSLPGFAAVEWSPAQIDEFVSRFEKYRELRRARELR